MMSPSESRTWRFFFPSLTVPFLVRVACVALSAYLFFNYLCLPLFIQGSSMEPTYHNGTFSFCWRLSYAFSEPKRHDPVVIRLAGKNALLLKRVVAVGGETVEFRDGKLFVDGREVEEPYVQYPCNWDMSPRTVEGGSVYVVGDNRSMPLENHYFGQTSLSRVIGAPLW